MIEPKLPARRTSPLSRRAFLGGCLVSLPACLRSQAGPAPVQPEEYGARGDGVSDDSEAFAAAFSTASRQGRSIALRAGAVYRLGRAGWQGLRCDSGLSIEGNQATLRIAALPAQGLAAGQGNAAIRVAGGRVAIRNLRIELGRLKVMALALDGCDIRIEGCTFSGGDRSNQSAGLYLTRCRGQILGNSGRDLGFLFYCGHTDRGMGSRGLRIADNQASDLGADFVVGVIRDSVVENNRCEGMFSGVALAALAQTGQFSENVRIEGNRFSGFRAHGIQTDVAGNIRNRNLIVRNNALIGGARASSGIYMLRIDGFEVSGNRIERCDYGIVIDAAADGIVASNDISAGVASGTRAIGMVAANGDIRGVRVHGNEGRGFRDGMMIEGQRGFTVSSIEIEGNFFADGEVGVRATVGLSGVAVRNNRFRANRRRDIEGGRGMIAANNRQEPGR